MCFRNFYLEVKAIYEKSCIIFLSITTKSKKLNETIYYTTH